jgi:hypothetical protein
MTTVLSQLRADLEAATEGEWEARDTDSGEMWADMGEEHEVFFSDIEGACSECYGNRRFTVSAHNRMALLLTLAEAASEIGVNALGVIAELIRPYGAVKRKGAALVHLADALAPLLEDA